MLTWVIVTWIHRCFDGSELDGTENKWLESWFGSLRVVTWLEIWCITWYPNALWEWHCHDLMTTLLNMVWVKSLSSCLYQEFLFLKKKMTWLALTRLDLTLLDMIKKKWVESHVSCRPQKPTGCWSGWIWDTTFYSMCPTNGLTWFLLTVSTIIIIII